MDKQDVLQYLYGSLFCQGSSTPLRKGFKTLRASRFICEVQPAEAAPAPPRILETGPRSLKSQLRYVRQAQVVICSYCRISEIQIKRIKLSSAEMVPYCLLKQFLHVTSKIVRMLVSLLWI